MSGSIAFLRKLLDAGMPLDMALMAAEAFEQEVNSKVDLRRAKDRDRKRRNSTLSAESAESEKAAETPLLDKEIPPTPPKEINPTPPPVRPLTRTNVPAPSPKAFDEFWLAYPRKVGKGAARKAFAKALGKISTEDPRATIMAALNIAKRAWADVDAQFIPHAATWLNQDRWEDEPFASGARPPDAADDELARADRLARVERMTPEERKAHYAAELEKWQSENPNLRAM